MTVNLARKAHLNGSSCSLIGLLVRGLASRNATLGTLLIAPSLRHASLVIRAVPLVNKAVSKTQRLCALHAPQATPISISRKVDASVLALGAPVALTSTLGTVAKAASLIARCASRPRPVYAATPSLTPRYFKMKAVSSSVRWARLLCSPMALVNASIVLPTVRHVKMVTPSTACLAPQVTSSSAMEVSASSNAQLALRLTWTILYALGVSKAAVSVTSMTSQSVFAAAMV